MINFIGDYSTLVLRNASNILTPSLKYLTPVFENAGDVLQYAFPTIVGLADLYPDLRQGNYYEAAKKATIICTLILIQNRGGLFLKNIFLKPRPNFPDQLDSFPSGHMMIAAQCATRVFLAYSGQAPRSLAVVIAATIGLGRYLPGRHDVVDLCGGAVLGAGLGVLWNYFLSPKI
jgi:membrane-associated phospholipid phosphatase